MNVSEVAQKCGHVWLHLWQELLPFRFLIVGGWNFVFSYVFFAFTYWLLHRHIHDAIIIVICSIVGITHAFLCHRFLTYRSSGSILKEYLRFYVVYSVQVGANFVLFLLFVRICRTNPYLTQALLTIGLKFISYWGHETFSFKKEGCS